MALGLFERSVGVVALLDEVHHLAEVDELVADDLVFLVERDAGAVALGHLEVTGFRKPYLSESLKTFSGLCTLFVLKKYFTL